MANTKAYASFRSLVPIGKQFFLPPKCPAPVLSPFYDDHGATGSRGIPNANHRRTSSESFLIEEQPPWLDDLLNEPESPVKRGSHRRSSSDSFAYLSGAKVSSGITNLALEGCRQISVATLSPWVLNELDNQRDINHYPYYVENNSSGRPQHRECEATTTMGSITLGKNKIVHSRAYPVPGERNVVPSDSDEKKDQQGSSIYPKCPSETEDSFSKQYAADPRSAKQQFARRSRVRKLQYIAELERNVQALQAKGSGISAELEFLDRQNLILNLENKALKQRLDSLSQEQLFKRFQQEMLEQEVAHLRTFYQQHQAAPLHGHRRSTDLDSQFANLSSKHSDMDAGADPVSNPLHI
ncbi:bZIP transcription factor domain containing protein [Musa troglodytarum]|nr:bZIP transcription factor domain containing protein [Musa troglodytarum]